MTVLWTGDFETGDLSQASTITGADNAAHIVTEPVRAGKYALGLTVDNSDPTKKSTQNRFNYDAAPEADIQAGHLLQAGDDVYIGFSLYVPALQPGYPGGQFPPITSPWYQTMEIYGPPYAGSPGVALGIEAIGGINRWSFRRDQPHNWDMPWSTVMRYNVWEDFVYHVVLSEDPAVGMVEIWYNDTKQVFTDGTTRLHYATLGPSNHIGPNKLWIDQYRKLDALGPGALTHYADEIRIATRFGEVVPPPQPYRVIVTDAMVAQILKSITPAVKNAVQSVVK